MIEYTQQQVLEDIKAIAENREYDIKLPLRVLKREQPEAYRKAYLKAYRKTDKYKAYLKTDKYKAYQKAYRKALSELKKKHANDFQKLLGKVQLNERGLD
jgi:hypothetical protein